MADNATNLNEAKRAARALRDAIRSLERIQDANRGEVAFVKATDALGVVRTAKSGVNELVHLLEYSANNLTTPGK